MIHEKHEYDFIIFLISPFIFHSFVSTHLFCPDIDYGAGQWGIETDAYSLASTAQYHTENESGGSTMIKH